MISDGSMLYGMAGGGGFGYSASLGVIFSITNDGTGCRIIKNFSSGLLDDGYNPFGSLISDGSNLYGMTVYGGTDDEGVVFSQVIPPTLTPTPTTTPTPNYINLEVSPAGVNRDGEVTLSWSCDFGTWNYHGVPVDVYLAAVKNPAVADCPSGVPEAQLGDRILFFGSGLKPSSRLEGPTFSGVSFPPVYTAGCFTFRLPRAASFVGGWKFTTAFKYTGTRKFVRSDGLPAENSNVCTIY